MKNEQNTISDLKYVKEHLYCEDYFSDEKAILSVAEMKANEYFIKEKVDSPKMLFVLSGTMVISTGSAVKQEVKGGQMFLVVTGDNFYGIAVTDLIILRCDFDRNRGKKKESRRFPFITCCFRNSRQLKQPSQLNSHASTTNVSKGISYS